MKRAAACLAALALGACGAGGHAGRAQQRALPRTEGAAETTDRVDRTARLRSIAARCGIDPAAVCGDEHANGCLEPTDAPGGALAFRYRDRAQWSDEGRSPLPHFLVQPMRSLRNAYSAAAPGSEDERVCERALAIEIEYLRSTLVQRGDAMVWENEDGLAQAMEQAEWAHVIASIAAAHAARQRHDEARTLTVLALALAAALDVPAAPRSGGVRSEERFCDDGTGTMHSCFWLHSRGVGLRTEGDAPRWVLNQHLHAVMDSLLLYETLARLVPADDPRRTRARERALGGLLVLLPQAEVTPDAPRPLPTLEDFRDPHGEHDWAHYEFDPALGRARGISIARTCHYHAHVLQLVANIARWADAHGDELALQHPLETMLRREGIVHALWESEQSASARHERGCPQPPLDPAAIRDSAFYLERFGASE
ncbi:hypothetical protein [Sandaracinus amylolyticus]|uniref:hypothetical protein n=1 Tax=Sandaracinus amylolyticus TaxID=927083 RepID=UPI001F26B09B|nr:hypothetical protein [Sandaracinus amylolyticus]UJR86885.1 Hypothetical protein I5071_89860 [Sandaracinus amylolyticus]